MNEERRVRRIAKRVPRVVPGAKYRPDMGLATPERHPQAPATDRRRVEETPPLLYNADDAARILGGVSKALVYRYVQYGELHPVKLGSRTLFTMAELERFVREHQS